jgi:ABC-type amino acid transport substrate-binding protein
MSLLSLHSGDYVTNLYKKVMNELACSLNFTLDIVSEMDEYGMWKSNDTWSGVMGEIVSGRADLAIADMSMTSLRVHYVDFTMPLIISRKGLFIREPELCGVKWLGYFQVIAMNEIN